MTNISIYDIIICIERIGQMGYIYGLDLSMSNTGVSIYDTEIKKFVHVSSITTKRIAERDSNFTQKTGRWSHSSSKAKSSRW